LQPPASAGISKIAKIHSLFIPRISFGEVVFAIGSPQLCAMTVRVQTKSELRNEDFGPSSRTGGKRNRLAKVYRLRSRRLLAKRRCERWQ
jgi:hypothetical protein